MSTRALRKAQKQREKSDVERHQDQEEESEDEADYDRSVKYKQSAFAMLGEDHDEEAEDSDEARVESEQADVDNNEPEDAPSTTTPKAKAKKKKKKKKSTQRAQTAKSEVDEIDAALKSLSTKVAGTSSLPPYNQEIAKEIFASDSKLLSVDPHHLQVAHEMRRIFGRAAFVADQEERNDRRNQVSQSEQVGLADAVTGRAAAGGPGLPQMLRKRNLFVQGREEWPRNTSNGLTMEVERREVTGVTIYRFVHTKQYSASQLAFAQSVATMDPTQMVMMLRLYPYNVALLLQVSEIAKQEKDYATAGELLERALFSFGKALHPTFQDAMANGKARLDFRRPENREFYLAASRYIANIGMRATWRTAFEWAKLILAMDPDQDPYCMRFSIDQLAIRAGQSQTFIDLANSKRFLESWKHLPNIQYSLGLATRQIEGKTPFKAASILKDAIRSAPWVAARFFQILDISKAPPAVWAKTAATEKDTLYCELYATQGQDLWKLPDATAFLKDTVTTMTTEDTEDPHHHTDPITLDEARYVILTDKPPLIGLIPREFTNKVDSMSDPLRPEDSIDSYFISPEDRAAGPTNPATLIQQNPRHFIAEFMGLQQFFETLVPDFAQSALTQDNIDEALRSSGLSLPEMRRRVQRLMDMRGVLGAQPGERVEAGATELRMAADGNTALYRAGGEEEEEEGGTLFGLDEEQARRVEREIQEEMSALEAADLQRAEAGDESGMPGSWRD